MCLCVGKSHFQIRNGNTERRPYSGSTCTWKDILKFYIIGQKWIQSDKGGHNRTKYDTISQKYTPLV